MHPILDKHWESVAFREFLEDGIGNDEIFFYLWSRAVLFQGLVLKERTSGKFCYKMFVK